MSNISAIRKINENLVLETVFKHGTVTRVDISRIAGLSKPTVSSIVDSLVKKKLLIAEGRTTGEIGRTAKIFRANPNSAYVIGIDLGGTNIRVALADVFGNIVAFVNEATGQDSGEAILEEIFRLCRKVVEKNETDWDRVKVIVLGTPGILDPKTGYIQFAPNIHGFGEINVEQSFKEAFQKDVYFENDVNLAALGEQSCGLTKQNKDFAFIALGTGLGMGLVVNGELYRGSNNIAGEIAYLPIGGDPFDPVNKTRGTLEEAIAGIGMREKLRKELVESKSAVINENSTMKEVFAAAEEANDPAAQRIVEHTAKLIAQAILAISVIVNPEVIVLGGGIGSDKVLLEPTRRAVSQMNPVNVDVEISRLGDQASMYGAIALGLKKVREKLFNQLDYQLD